MPAENASFVAFRSTNCPLARRPTVTSTFVSVGADIVGSSALLTIALDQGETPQLDDAELAAQLALEDGLATANDSGSLAANANQLVTKAKRVKGDVWWNQLEDPIERLPKNYSPGESLRDV